MKITVEFTPAQEKALASIALDPESYVTHGIQAAAQRAIDEIAHNEIQRRLAAGETISGSKEDIVLAADISTAAERVAAAHKQQQAILLEEIPSQPPQ
jgi:hypothetical protein